MSRWPEVLAKAKGLLFFPPPTAEDLRIEREDSIVRAARRGDASEMLRFLNEGVDIHAMGDSALSQAAGQGHVPILRLLLEKGAFLHAEQACALLNAAQEGHLDAVDLTFAKSDIVSAHSDFAGRVAVSALNNLVLRR